MCGIFPMITGMVWSLLSSFKCHTVLTILTAALNRVEVQVPDSHAVPVAE